MIEKLPKVCTFRRIQLRRKTAIVTELNRFLNIVVVRQTRESTDALGPIKKFGQIWQDNQCEQKDRHRKYVCPWVTHVNLCRISRYAENRIKRSIIYINFYFNSNSRLVVHYADGHSCSLKTHGP